MKFSSEAFGSFRARPRANALIGAAIGTMFLVPAAFSEEPKASPGAKGNAKAISAKGEDRTPAMTINFAKSLGLPFESLTTLGSRIELAMKASDPVCLASLAKELAVGEQVSGKAASLTSAELSRDAVRLAEARSISVELKAVAQYVRDEETAARLARLAIAAEKREDAARRAFEAGERTRGITQNLMVHNNTGSQIFIYHDGVQLGWVNPYDNFTYFVGAGPNQNSVLTARSADGSRTWGPTVIDQVYANYNWTLN
jgi:hypothetical protein